MLGKKIVNWVTTTRIITGVIAMVYCLTHFMNHATGIISLEAMDVTRVYVSGFWRLPVIKPVVPSALIIHVVVSLFLFFRSRTLKKKDAGVIIQLITGLLIPFMLIGHISFTRGTYNKTGQSIHMAHYI